MNIYMEEGLKLFATRTMVFEEKKCLNVCVTEWSTHGAHCRLNCDVPSIGIAQRYGVTKLRGGCRWVGNSNRPVDGVGTLRGVEILPCPPHTVDLRMMKEEVRVSRGGEEVGAWVATNRKMAGRVHAHEVVLERGNAALHVAPKGLDVLAIEQLDDRGIIGPLARRPRGNIAFKTTWVVSETDFGIHKVADGVRRCAGQVSEDGAEIHWPILQGARGYTAATFALWDLDHRCFVGRDPIEGLVRTSSDTIATNRRSGTVKHRRLHRVVGPSWPVVVGLIAFVPTLFSESLLIRMGEVAVPRKEVTSIVDGEGLLNVCRNKVIIPILAARTHRRRSLGRQLAHALDRRDVILLLRSRKSSPFASHNDIQRIARLPLSGLLCGLEDLLIDGSKTGVDISL